MFTTKYQQTSTMGNVIGHEKKLKQDGQFPEDRILLIKKE